jgi:hypothetical protein
VSSFLTKHQTVVENLSEKQDYEFVATFEATNNESINERLKKVLNWISSLHKSETSITENKNGEIICVISNPKNWNLNEKLERDQFARAFYNSCKSMSRDTGINVSFTAIFRNVYDNLAKKLPELQGIFNESSEKQTNDTYVCTIKFKGLSEKDLEIVTRILKIKTEVALPIIAELIYDNDTIGIRYFNLPKSTIDTVKDGKWYSRYLDATISKIFPKMRIDVVNDLLDRIAETMSVKYCETRFYELEQKLPELDGVFENHKLFPYGLEGYGDTGIKCKFAIGDEVLVEDPLNRWKTYQNQKSKEALNNHAIIMGYKYVQGAYSKYAIKLENGNIYGVHSHFLRGLTEDELKMKEVIKKLPELEGIF